MEFRWGDRVRRNIEQERVQGRFEEAVASETVRFG
jgi:hypothetical protein